MGPLDGVKIVELAEFQTAGGDVVLAEMGADVIKVEDPVRGDSLRGLSELHSTGTGIPGGGNIVFDTSSRSKKSITLNLKDERGKEIFHKLLEKADIFYTNYRENVLRRLGADFDTLSQRQPLLIYGLVSTFGSKGPWGERRGYDFQAQACSGLMFAMGERDFHEPILVYGSVCDQSAGTMLAFGLLAALLARDRQGIGQKVEVSLYGTMVYLQSTGVNVTSFRDRPWARHSRSRVREPLTNYYRCADDKWILLCEMRGDQFWPQLARAMGLESLAEDSQYATVSGRRTNHEEVIRTLDQAFATKSLQEWLDTFQRRGLDKAGLAYSPVNNYRDVLDDPQASANGYIVNFNHPAVGEMKLAGPPISFSATPARIKYAAPEHGQHTEEVLSEELGYSWEEMAKLRDEGAI